MTIERDLQGHPWSCKCPDRSLRLHLGLPSLPSGDPGRAEGGHEADGDSVRGLPGAGGQGNRRSQQVGNDAIMA